MKLQRIIPGVWYAEFRGVEITVIAGDLGQAFEVAARAFAIWTA